MHASIPAQFQMKICIMSVRDELKYNKRKEIKKSFYKKYKKNLIELTDKDVENLDDIIPIKLRRYLPPTFSFD